MTVISLTRGGAADAAGVTPPRRRRGRIALARIGGGLAVLVPIVFLSSFITYCLGALSDSNPAATILGRGGLAVFRIFGCGGVGLASSPLDLAPLRSRPAFAGLLGRLIGGRTHLVGVRRGSTAT